MRFFYSVGEDPHEAKSDWFEITEYHVRSLTREQDFFLTHWSHFYPWIIRFKMNSRSERQRDRKRRKWLHFQQTKIPYTHVHFNPCAVLVVRLTHRTHGYHIFRSYVFLPLLHYLHTVPFWPYVAKHFEHFRIGLIFTMKNKKLSQICTPYWVGLFFPVRDYRQYDVIGNTNAFYWSKNITVRSSWIWVFNHSPMHNHIVKFVPRSERINSYNIARWNSDDYSRR